MAKCASSVPLIKEFLEEFSDVKGSIKETTGRNTTTTKYGISSTSRTLYPTFMNTATKPEKPWIAPVSDKSNCEIPKTAYVAAVCVSSCATPEQQILVQVENEKKMKYVPFIDALVGKIKNVETLSSESRLETKTVSKTSVQQWVTELMDTEHEILVFKTKSGRSLRVTPNHPLLSSEGMMKTADQFTEKDSIVELGGDLDPILQIEKTKYTGKVYNLFVNSDEPLRNVVITNGFLNGTAFYQNEGAVNMNRSLLRSRVTQGAFHK